MNCPKWMTAYRWTVSFALLLVAGCASDYDAIAPTDKPYGTITFQRVVGEHATGKDVLIYKRPRTPYWTIDGVAVYSLTDDLDNKSIRAKLGSHIIAMEGRPTPTLLLTVQEGVVSYLTDYVYDGGWGYKVTKEEPDPNY